MDNRLLFLGLLAALFSVTTHAKPLLCKQLKEQAVLYCNDGKFYKMTTEVDSLQKGEVSSIMSGKDELNDTVKIDFGSNSRSQGRSSGGSATSEK